MSVVRAAVDVGSNSTRLLVVDEHGQRLTRELAITRLAAGVDATGRFDDAALARTLDAIAAYRDRWQAHGATRVRIVATSAVRDAADRDRFFTGVRELTGIDAEVVTGQEEAALAFAGAAGVAGTSGTVMVADVGGGSTELVIGRPAGEVQGVVSLQLGCVRLTERHLHHDPPTAAEVTAARTMVAEQLEQAAASLASQGTAIDAADRVVGVAGTATTLAALHLRLDTYQEDLVHGARVPADALETLASRLLGCTAAERAALGPVQSGREDVLHGGALVLAELLARTGGDQLVISEADNLDGLVASLA